MIVVVNCRPFLVGAGAKRCANSALLTLILCRKF